MFETAIILILLASMMLIIFRAIKGPSIYDRMLAVNVFGTVTVVLLVLLGYFFKYLETLDIALVYALINFITTLAYLKYFKYKSLDKE